MKKGINFYRLLKMLCAACGVIFLLAACSSDEGANFSSKDGSNDESAIIAGHAECWQKSLISTFYESLGKMATDVYTRITAEDIMSLMMLAFSVWLAYQILRHISATVPESIGEFWTTVLRKGALCIICGILASKNENIIYAINTFIFPIYITMLEFASEVMSLVGDGINCKLNNPESVKMTATEFPQAPQDLMGCMACAVSSKLDKGYEIAFRVFFSVEWVGVMVGIFLLVTFTIAKFSFAFYLVDSIFRMVMMIIIMPFLIMFYPFEQTRRWAVSGFKIILNSAAMMMCLAILVTTSISAINEVLSHDGIGKFDDVEKYKTLGSVPLALIFLGFAVVKITKIAVSLSNSVIGGGGDTNFQRKVTALIGTVGSLILAAVTLGAGKIITSMLAHSARLRAAQQRIQKIRERAAKVRNKMNQLAGRQPEDNEEQDYIEDDEDEEEEE